MKVSVRGMCRLVIGMAAFACSAVHGALVHLPGATVDFYYDPAQVDPLFGSISVVGDSIRSFPLNFRAESTNGAGVVNVSALGTVIVKTKPGYEFDSVTVSEVGDYQMTSHAANSVNVSGWLNLFDWNDILGPFETTTLAISGDLTLKDDSPHTWTGSGSFDMTTATWDGIDEVGLQLQNNLSATTLDAGASAWIQKKLVAGVGITIETVPFATPVPVPGALWLFGSGLLALAGMSRRREKA